MNTLYVIINIIQMFCEIQKAFHKITSYSRNDQEYTKEVKQFIEKLSYLQFDYIQNNINNQKKLLDREYAVYKLNYDDLERNKVR